MDELENLPRHKPDDLHAERLRRRVHAELARRRSLWSRYVLPTVLTGTCAGYLWWALSFTANLYR